MLEHGLRGGETEKDDPRSREGRTEEAGARRRRLEAEGTAHAVGAGAAEQGGRERKHRGERDETRERREKRHQYPLPGTPPPAP